MAAETNPPDFLRETSYWTMMARNKAEEAQRTQTNTSNASWASKVKTEMKEGSSWAHKMSKVIEPRQYKPAQTPNGPSLAAADLLQDQVDTWAKHVEGTTQYGRATIHRG